MISNPKTRKRLRIFVVSLLVLACLAVGGYGVRKYYVRKRALAARVEGVAAAKAGDWERALHKMGIYVQVFPDDAEARFYYARAREQVADPDGKHIREAIWNYRRVVELQPDHVEARYRLLDLYAQQHYFPETIDAANGILERKKDDPRAMREKAKALAVLRRFSEALPVAQRCNEIAPLDLDVQILTLRLMHQIGQAKDAILARAEALNKSHANDARFELLLSVACSICEDRPKAIELARKAASRNFIDADFINALVEQLDSFALFGDSFQVLDSAARSSRLPLLEAALIGRLIQMGRTNEVAERLSELDPKNSSSSSELLRAARSHWFG